MACCIEHPVAPAGSPEARTTLIRRALAALRAGDLAALLADCAPDIVVEHVGDPLCLPYAGRHHGHAGLRDYLRRLDSTVDILGYDPVEMAASGADRVLVLGREHLRFRATGLETRGPWVHLFVTAGGCITAVTIWSDGAGHLTAYRGY